ncbi:MAG: hypothetical protein SGJ27_30005 [Candidatus Melainabacteria bacterium]|nr:hypothetical protein [Candidatus Melainabacteria bacterium]
MNAQKIILESTSGTFNLPGTYTATKSISLSSQGGIFNSNVSGTLTSPHLRVESTAGSIGIDAANRFNPGVGIAAIEAISTVSDVFLAGPNIKTFTISGGFAQDTFDYLGAGSTTVTGDITAQALTAGDKISLAIATGKLNISGGVTLFSQRDLQLLVTAPTALAKKSSILIGKDVEIITSSSITGDILISVGDPGAPVAGVKPANVSTIQLAGSSIFFGTFGLKAKSPTNSLFAQGGANITFNNPVGSKNISLGGGVVMVGSE